MSRRRKTYVLTETAARDFKAARAWSLSRYLVYVPLGKKQIAIVALIRQTRDVPTILQENGFLIRRALAAALESG